MTEYTPTTAEVRAAASRSIGGDWFDRWLAEHDRQVAERAWNDALAHVSKLSDPARTIEITPDRELITLQDVQQAIGDNPYRAAKGEQK